MPIATTTLIASALIASAAASAGQMVQANQNKQDAKGVANENKDEMKKATDEAAAQSASANNLSTSNALRDAAKARQQSIIGNSMGRGSTILTGGLGVSQPANTGSKSLLGQ